MPGAGGTRTSGRGEISAATPRPLPGSSSADCCRAHSGGSMGRERAIRWSTLFASAIVLALAAWAGQRRLRIDTDITGAVPVGNPAFESARQVLARHTALDKVAINLSMRDGHADAAALLAAGDALVAALERSGQFTSVGTAAAA